MNKSVMERLQDHYNEALEYFPEERIVGIFLQGSQNYGMEVPNSDVDTKLIVIPSFEDICFNRKPKSHTHIRENEEHIDFKDIRLMFQTFRKQNLNFIEILFTEYKIINPMYAEEWNKLVAQAEQVAHYNRFYAIKAMKGIALEKYHALKHPYPSKLAVLEKYGYDPKQLHHLLRVEEFLVRYIAEEPYRDCIHPTNADWLKAVKLGLYELPQAELIAKVSIDNIEKICYNFNKGCDWDVCDEQVDQLLDEVQKNIIKISLQRELCE